MSPMTESGQEIHRYMIENRSHFLTLLRTLVELETPSDDPSSFSRIFEVLQENLAALNFDVEQKPGRNSAGTLIFRPRDYDPARPSQLALAHCDTVWEKGTLKEMPFTISENKVMGPGVFDMKAGICMMITALRSIRYLDRTPELQPVFLISTDEETGSGESKEWIIEEARLAERTFVLEPSLGREGKIKTERKGIGLFEIEVTGNPSHAGLDPEKGASAILGLSNIVQKLVELNSRSKEVNINVGKIEGGERANVVAAKSKAVVDVRIPSKSAGERIRDEIYQLKSDVKGVEVNVTGGIRRLPLEKNRENQRLWETAYNLGRQLDLELTESATGGVSDGNFSNLYSPTIDGLGAVGEGAHAYHEKIYLEETLNRAALLTMLLLHPSLTD